MLMEARPPGERIARLKSRVLSAPYEICIERARWFTRAHALHAGEHPSLVAAYGLADTLDHMTLYILPEERVAGNRSSKILGAVIPVERGEINMVLEHFLDTILTRPDRPFSMDPGDRQEFFDEILPFWKGKTVRDFKRRAWEKAGLMRAPSIGPLAGWRLWKSFGPKTLGRTLAPYLKGDKKKLLRMKSDIAVNNPNLVDNVFDVQGHLTLGIGNIIGKGFSGLWAEAGEGLAKAGDDPDRRAFYEAVKVVCEAIRRYGDRLAVLAESMAAGEEDPARKGELLEMAVVLSKVSWKPPESFYEAIQFTWLAQVTALVSHGMVAVLAIGRADQYLYPYYKRELDAGTLDPDFALALAEELFIKLSYNLLVLPEFAKHTGSELGADNCAVTVGGVDENGADAANELTDLFMEAIGNIGSMTNSFSIRMGSHSSREYLEKVAGVFARTCGPAVFNDDVIVPAQEACGYSLADARNYSVIGCVEPAGEGDTFGCTSGNDVSLAGVLEMVLTDGRIRMMGKRTGARTGDPAKFTSFGQVLEAFQKQMAVQVDLIAACVNEKDRVYMERFHNPCISMTLSGCLETGRDMTAGGAKYNFSSIGGRGLATVADSLTVIKKAVFEDRLLSMAELVRLCDTNFSGAEPLRQRLVHKIPKYGNNEDGADEMAAWLAGIFCDEVARHRTVRGGFFRPGFFSYGMHVYDGSLLGATPNGRLAGTPVSNSMSPTSGSERRGPTAVINSYCTLPHRKISNGSSLNVRLSPALVRTEKGKKNLAALLAAFIAGKGMHVQFNVIDDATLRDAQAHPENYTDLVVRVSGYCAYFTDLGPAIQEEVLSRIAFSEY
ncbi:MAG: hypothetical protein KKA60_03835 [Proteobacteria bacterium]|nr:hypothetical protein [Pseudomonadota bacterium]